jgi:cellulose synthase/poly-beta-1,6-N-acetylglucosamine synthase-like glycosyltransferase
VGGAGAVNDLSVVVPLWDDYVAYLPDCLTAVRAQNVDAHIIVVDNASTIPVPSQDFDVTVVKTERRHSAGAARNTGLRAVDTEFVSFVDADDTVLPGTWSFLLDRMRRDPTVVAAAAQLWWFDPLTGEERPAASPRPHVYRYLRGRRKTFCLYMALRMALPTTTVTVFRTRAVVDAGGFGDSNHAEDWALAAAVALRGRVEQYARPGARVLLHEGSLFNRPLTRREIDGGMRAVRRRLRADPWTPVWLCLLLGPIAVFHRLKAAANARRPAFDHPANRR